MVMTGVAMQLARVCGGGGRPHLPVSQVPLQSSILDKSPRLILSRKNSQPTLNLETDFSSLLLSSKEPGYRLFPINTPNRGVGGAYFIKQGDRPAGVFKPYDEEAVPDEDQEKEIVVGKEIKPGLLYGEGYLKEVAAYLLDRDGFLGVPTTTLFRVGEEAGSATPKVGSLQQYVSHTCTAEDIGWNTFPVDEVQKIGILDCRLLNTDRHLGNILVVKDTHPLRLVPIDHGLCLPSSLSGGYFEWLSFPQAKQPFSQRMLDYIENLNVEADIQMLQKRLPLLRKECLDTLRICSMFVQKAAKSGLNLHQIGCLMSRYHDIDEPSMLENIYLKTYNKVNHRHAGPDIAANETALWNLLSEEMDLALYNYCNCKK